MKILIATDDSEFGKSAVAFGCLVIPAKSTVRLVTVIEPAAGIELETLIEDTNVLADPQNPEGKKATAVLNVAEQTLSENCSDKEIAVSKQALVGPAARAIVEEAERWGAELIVLGSHGRGFWKRTLLGSVSNRVLNHAPCSVLIVR